VKRSDRLNEVRRVIQTERDGASQRLAHKQSSLAFAGNRLQELLQYREDYLRRFRKDAGAGLSGTRVRDYQTFLAKLDQAIRQQQSALAKARAEADFEREKLRDISGQLAAVSGVADRWSGEERRTEERLDQQRSDELSQRNFISSHTGKAS
jgi:flagellar FliJ protein